MHRSHVIYWELANRGVRSGKNLKWEAVHKSLGQKRCISPLGQKRCISPPPDGASVWGWTYAPFGQHFVQQFLSKFCPSGLMHRRLKSNLGAFQDVLRPFKGSDLRTRCISPNRCISPSCTDEPVHKSHFVHSRWRTWGDSISAPGRR